MRVSFCFLLRSKGKNLYLNSCGERRRNLIIIIILYFRMKDKKSHIFYMKFSRGFLGITLISVIFSLLYWKFGKLFASIIFRFTIQSISLWFQHSLNNVNLKWISQRAHYSNTFSQSWIITRWQLKINYFNIFEILFLLLQATWVNMEAVWSTWAVEAEGIFLQVNTLLNINS